MAHLSLLSSGKSDRATCLSSWLQAAYEVPSSRKCSRLKLPLESLPLIGLYQHNGPGGTMKAIWKP
uniref:Uncharacterized protein n=1 Tax=Cucumis melo TaxID=3656 RepID=A0A9I9CK15_CUCME